MGNLDRRVAFILEADRLKGVIRRSYVLGGERHENSAEHSWHVALLAMTLCEYSDVPVDADRVMRILMVHDLVEVYAGDTIIYDVQARAAKAEKEREAAGRIFGLLPDDDARRLRSLWEEYEGRTTPEARMAHALDRFMPLLHNFHTEGRAWREHGITRAQVLEINKHIGDASTRLWEYVQDMIDRAVELGYLAE